MTMTSNANGAVDVLNNKLMMDMSTTIPGSTNMNMLYYIVEEVVFIKMDYFGSDQWMQMNFSDYNISWDTYDQMNMQIDLLDYGEVERLDDEVINNIDCYVLKIIPDFEKLYEILMNQQGLSTGIPQDTYFSEMIDEFSLKIWISKDNNLIIKAYEHMSMDLNLFGYSYSMSLEMDIRFFEYNEPVLIELPAEAQDSIDYSDYIYESYSYSPA